MQVLFWETGEWADHIMIPIAIIDSQDDNTAELIKDDLNSRLHRFGLEYDNNSSDRNLREDNMKAFIASANKTYPDLCLEKIYVDYTGGAFYCVDLPVLGLGK